MTALDRRAFVAAAATSIVAPAAARAKECPAAGMDWMTMSLEARNLAFNNVAHVGADLVQAKTESGPRPRKRCARSGRSISIWPTLRASGPSGTSIPPPTR